MLGCPYKKSNSMVQLLRRAITEAGRKENFIVNPGNVHRKFYCKFPADPYSFRDVAVMTARARSRILREVLSEFEQT